MEITRSWQQMHVIGAGVSGAGGIAAWSVLDPGLDVGSGEAGGEGGEKGPSRVGGARARR